MEECIERKGRVWMKARWRRGMEKKSLEGKTLTKRGRWTHRGRHVVEQYTRTRTAAAEKGAFEVEDLY
jgi:hypothetical protein